MIEKVYNQWNTNLCTLYAVMWACQIEIDINSIMYQLIEEGFSETEWWSLESSLKFFRKIWLINNFSRCCLCYWKYPKVIQFTYLEKTHAAVIVWENEEWYIIKDSFWEKYKDKWYWTLKYTQVWCIQDIFIIE